eukprot:40645-Chlamydomonas_euryale.AAC.9
MQAQAQVRARAQARAWRAGLLHNSRRRSKRRVSCYHKHAGLPDNEAWRGTRAREAGGCRSTRMQPADGQAAKGVGTCEGGWLAE